MNERPGSCNVSLPAYYVDCEGRKIVPEAKPQRIPVEQIPPEKLKVMMEYAKNLRKKFPHFKPDRLKKKVAEHFKIKLT